MFFFIQLLLACNVVLTASTAIPTPALHSQGKGVSSTPLPPSQDPFYTAPKNYESARPGTILRIRAAPGNLTTVVGNCSSAYNILYRTTDTRYKPSWAVTTLFVPLSSSTTETSKASEAKPKGSALLSYQVPYDSVDIDSGPSYAFYAAPPSDLASALGRGWFVNVPDYEGPLASLGAGVQAGHATIDSVRAVLSSNLGLAANARYALWGFSGGSLASEWAAELQVQYAPELKFSGAALGGLLPNMSRLMESVVGEPLAGLFPPCLLGTLNQHPEAYEYILSKLKPTGPFNRTTFLSIKDLDLHPVLAKFANQDLYEYFVDGKKDFEAPIVQNVFEKDGLMGCHGIPRMPLFVYKAIADEVSPVEDTDGLVNKYCALGRNILYQRNTVGSHLDEQVNGDARAFEWLSSVLDGTHDKKYSPQGCTIQNVTVSAT